MIYTILYFRLFEMQMARRDCANAQARLVMCTSHMSLSKLCCDAGSYAVMRSMFSVVGFIVLTNQITRSRTDIHLMLFANVLRYFDLKCLADLDHGQEMLSNCDFIFHFLCSSYASFLRFISY